MAHKKSAVAGPTNLGNLPSIKNNNSNNSSAQHVPFASPLTDIDTNAAAVHIPSSTQFGPLSPIKSITSSLSQKDITIQLRQLAQDPKQQILLITNADCLKTLCNVLSSDNIETCVISLQTLQLLALNPNYRETLKNVPGLTQRIDILIQSNQIKVQKIAKHLSQTINSRFNAKNLQKQYQPRPLHALKLTIVNLNNDKDRDEIQTIGIKVKGIISITVNMQSRIVTFYCSRGNVQEQLIKVLRTKGFQVQSEEEKEMLNADVISMHSGVSNFTDYNNNKGNLASLRVSGMGNENRISNNTNKSKQTKFIKLAPDDDEEILSGPQYIEPKRFASSSNYGITVYRQTPNVMTLAERLEHEKKLEQEEQRKKQQTDSFLTKVISYIW